MQGDGVRELLAAAREMGCDYLENEPMRLHTTFKIGGPARVLLFPETEEQITALVQCARANGVRLLTIGNGSNLLVSDKGIDAAVLVMDKHFSAVTVKGNTIFAQAGASLMKVCRTALEHSLTGLEFAYGIPGSCGGAAFMNAGAGGRYFSDILESVLVYKDGRIRVLLKEECGYGYKHSVFMDDSSVILGASLLLDEADGQTVARKRAEFLAARRKLPKGRSMGCVFKNPPDVPAGKLIDGAGLKGLRVGGAVISPQHANFIINEGGATSADVKALINLIKNAVFAQYGVGLEEEIRYL